MSQDMGASIFVFHPKRVTLAELAQIRAEQAEVGMRSIRMVGSSYSVTCSRCSPAAAPEPSSLHEIAPTQEPLPVCAAAVAPEPSSAPLLPCSACPHVGENLELRQQVGYWKGMHRRACQREDRLKQRIAELEAEVRDLKHRVFGRKSESASSAKTSPAATAQPNTPPRPRGQQRDKPGPRRRDHSHLPVVDEIIELPKDQRCCAQCQLPFAPLSTTEDSEVIEIKVKAYRRRYRRRRYQPTCSCDQHPCLITAPPADRLYPKCTLAVSIWVEVLLDKFQFYRPTYRLLQDWQTHGLGLSLGTLTDGLKRMLPLFEPIYQDLIKHNQQQKHWHGDETRWMVFATVEGKIGHRWMMWAFQSQEVVVFVLSSGRAHDVPENHFGPVKEGILSVDRYSAYKAMAQVKEGKILLAFCWAHVRRDFLEVERSWPKEKDWAVAWVERIAELYQRNDERLEVLDKGEDAAREQEQLEQHVQAMAKQAEKELAEAKIHPARKKVLRSLQDHWEGLTLFLKHPEVPLDNNAVERTERGPVVGRKNYYGSGAEWAGNLAAMQFSLLATLRLWQINPRVWLTEYLQACARAGGQPPGNREAFLPWKMTQEKRKEWSLKQENDREDNS
jgi:transposase